LGVLFFCAWKIVSFYAGYYSELNKAMDFK
jgi:hypothetical protein